MSYHVSVGLIQESCLCKVKTFLYEVHQLQESIFSIPCAYLMWHYLNQPQVFRLNKNVGFHQPSLQKPAVFSEESTLNEVILSTKTIPELLETYMNLQNTSPMVQKN